jgi:tetratricopeptide (TPR) repeat protein
MPAAVNLLGRAEALLPHDDPDRFAALATLGEALLQSGELDRAGEVLAAAISGATAAGQKAVEARAVVSRAFLRIFTDPEGATEEARAEVERLLPELEELGDDLALAYVWHLQGQVHLMESQYAKLAEAGERALIHARRAEDRRQEGEMVFWTLAGYNFGPLPVVEAISRAEELLAAATGNRVAEAGALGHLAVLKAKRGEFDTARSMYSRAVAIVEELGMLVHLGGLSMGSGWIERLAGTPEAAEPVLRRADALLEKIGEKAYRSTLAAVLAEVVYDQHRYDEAEELTRLSAELAAPDDLASQVGWRSVRAKVLARRGELVEAERLGQEAVDIGARTDALDWRADALADLAEVLRLAGRPADAAARLEEALRLFEAKGVVPSVARTRELLAELAQPPATA